MVTKLAVTLMMAAAPHWFSSTLLAGDLPKCKTKAHAKCVKKCCVKPGAKCRKKCKIVRLTKDDAARVADGRSEAVFFGEGEEGDAHVAIELIGHGGLHGHDAAMGAGHAIFVGGPDGEDGEARVIVLKGDADADGNAFVWSSDDEDGAEHAVQFKVLARVGEDDADAPKQGWLGVSIKTVSDEMADQLEIEGRGILVVNVIKDSPAELGGIQANDVIMAINDDAVTGEVGNVVELVSGHAPGEEIDVTVLRGGEEQTLSITLSSRAEIKEGLWKFDVAPFAEIEENVTAHGKMLRRGAGGEWVFEDLGDLTNIKELRDQLQLDIPGGASHFTKVFVDGNSKSVKLEIKTDEGELSITQEDGGEITVTRTDENDTETTIVYENEDDLAEGDPDAFEHYSSSGKPVVLDLSLHGLKRLGDVDFNVELKGLKDGLFDWRTDLHEQLSEAHSAYREAMEQAREGYEEAVAAWREKSEDENGAAEFDMPFFPLPGDHAMFMGKGLHRIGKPKHTFNVGADGAIEVRIRRGDSELVRSFENEEDLAERNPVLYGKYQELMDADEE